MTVAQIARTAREAARELSAASLTQRNEALNAMAAALDRSRALLVKENSADVEAAREAKLDPPLLSRLELNDKKIDQLIGGLKALVKLPDPLNRTLLARELTPGLNLYRMSCPIGVLGVVFESRPDALVQIASLALKSGNAVLLKGGREAARTNAALFDALDRAVRDTGIPTGWAGLLQTREDVTAMLALDEDIDLIIPRGSNAFVRYIMEHTHIPVMGHAEGLCHTYIDKNADVSMAVSVTVDAKTQAYAVCNATETLLVHRDIAEAFLPKAAEALRAKGVRLLGDEMTREIINCEPASEEDWATEYLAPVLSIKTVGSVEEAVNHINRYGSRHTDAIITTDEEARKYFVSHVDSAGVYVNCSTRFADGFRYGFGAEVGISTSRLHARGPVGLEGLCTYKYVLLGSGQTVAGTLDGTWEYTHRDL
ncbi:MAG: glutamate-5-semialdehyde dehydrogenase [Clostridia bacterium]|nr:glutamate-5-semialdehyde dehydrogenase [Clostridia bacterium]